MYFFSDLGIRFHKFAWHNYDIGVVVSVAENSQRKKN